MAGLATFGAYRLLAANSEAGKVKRLSVLVANRDIPEGAAIDRVALTATVIPVEAIPVGAFTKLDSVAGRVARVNIFNGEVIVPGRLAPVGTGPGLELKIPAGQRAMAIRVNDVAGISGLLLPNSRVDVLVTIADLATNKRVAKLFMENMRVLSVGTQIQRGDDGNSTKAATVTLGVTPDEAERLAIAMNTGEIQLVLRGYGDPDSVRTRGATSVDVLSQLRGAPIAAPRTENSPARSRPRAAQRPVAAPVVVQKPLPKPDSAVVEIYRAGKANSLKFDTTGKR